MLIKLRKSRVLGKQGFLSSHASVKHPQGRVRHRRSLPAALPQPPSRVPSHPSHPWKGSRATAPAFLVKRSLCFFFFYMNLQSGWVQIMANYPPTLLANKINFLRALITAFAELLYRKPERCGSPDGSRRQSEAPARGAASDSEETRAGRGGELLAGAAPVPSAPCTGRVAVSPPSPRHGTPLPVTQGWPRGRYRGRERAVKLYLERG